MAPRNRCWLLLALIVSRLSQAGAGEIDLRAYLRDRVAMLAARAPQAVDSAAAWNARRGMLRADLQNMLGLAPPPPRGDLCATVTGVVERGGVVVEKLHFQSLPGLYVTANFYRPLETSAPLPTVLYLCGHSRVVEHGVSMGNKAGYQHHGAWFARNGYNCLTIDTLQLGEIEGLHHGTYREGMWWWVARGYTPAGVEAWNAIRALDYLETRPEVDRARIGVTGRSGGGAYTWWVAALDDRPACIVPVAGITDLQNHVVDDCIEGHCDCMFMVNRLGWDFDTVAALAAPVPCLLSNTDKDGIFPLDGVVRVHDRLRRHYRSLGAADKLGLNIGEGPHQDTQDLQVPAFRWFNRWLRGVDEPIRLVAEKLFTPAELKVFTELPADARNARIHETFVPAAAPVEPPRTHGDWETLRHEWLERLQRECFAAWPDDAMSLEVARGAETRNGAEHATIEFTSEAHIRPRILLAQPRETAHDSPLVLHVVGEDGATYRDRRPEQVPHGERWAFFAPRGCGAGALPADIKARTHLARRFVLVGTTLDEGRVWDIRRAVAALRASGEQGPITLAARGDAAGLALYASLFEGDVAGLKLQSPSTSHRQGPNFIHVLRVLDLPQAVALALPRRIEIADTQRASWAWAEAVATAVYGADRRCLLFEASAPSPAQ